MLKHTKGNLLDLAEAGDFDVIIQGWALPTYWAMDKFFWKEW